MPTTAANVTHTLMSAPLPLLIEKLGLAIATAQVALDKNSLAMASSMASNKITIDGKEQNLISLGFAPTFYAFTEATIEARLEFSLAESEDFSIGASVGFNLGGNNSSGAGGTSGAGGAGDKQSKTGVIAVSVNAAYARKYEMKAEGSSSIATRLISLPPPDRLKEILNDISNKVEIPITAFTISTPGSVLTLAVGASLQLTANPEPADTTDTAITWQTSTPTLVSINATGLVTAIAAGQAVLKVKSVAKPTVEKEITLTIQ